MFSHHVVFLFSFSSFPLLIVRSFCETFQKEDGKVSHIEVFASLVPCGNLWMVKDVTESTETAQKFETLFHLSMVC